MELKKKNLPKVDTETLKYMYQHTKHRFAEDGSVKTYRQFYNCHYQKYWVRYKLGYIEEVIAEQDRLRQERDRRKNVIMMKRIVSDKSEVEIEYNDEVVL